MSGGGMYEQVKRFIDVAASLLALALAALPMAMIAIAIRVTMGPPVIYRSARPGMHEVPFVILKFRTMTNETSAPSGAGLSDEERLTRLGKWLRSFSLDELPELINVLNGEMSFVGPRPLLMRYLDRYTDEQARRHQAKPGITGWAQVNGRNALTWEEKLKLDIWYIDNRTILLDLGILGRTLSQVVRRTGISADSHATMPEFWGPKGDKPEP